ncbi:hypothetical protein ABT063_02120 [Streptomyces sp. NPDC002838]|uniref:hypothetical protein n=1 Tax=Streptomyces sp. NPDC002838 TaxID=3154436 RepID=UPI00332E317A
MSRPRGITRFAITIAIATSVLAACSGDDKDKALELAREACNMEFPDVSGDPLTDAAARQDSRDKILPRMDKAADKAAQAARLDDTWQPLATAFNNTAELVSVTLELGDLRETKIGPGYSSPDDVDKDNRLSEQHTALSNNLNNPTVEGECRKTTGS